MFIWMFMGVTSFRLVMGAQAGTRGRDRTGRGVGKWFLIGWDLESAIDGESFRSDAAVS